MFSTIRLVECLGSSKALGGRKDWRPFWVTTWGGKEQPVPRAVEVQGVGGGEPWKGSIYDGIAQQDYNADKVVQVSL
jgi:hypothetical protein